MNKNEDVYIFFFLYVKYLFLMQVSHVETPGVFLENNQSWIEFVEHEINNFEIKTSVQSTVTVVLYQVYN